MLNRTNHHTGSSEAFTDIEIFVLDRLSPSTAVQEKVLPRMLAHYTLRRGRFHPIEARASVRRRLFGQICPAWQAGMEKQYCRRGRLSRSGLSLSAQALRHLGLGRVAGAQKPWCWLQSSLLLLAVSLSALNARFDGRFLWRSALNQRNANGLRVWQPAANALD